jgi:hypothetical protein
MCFAISVKRYALFRRDRNGTMNFLDEHPPSENGLGQFLNPDDPGSDSKEWVQTIWRIMLARAYGDDVVLPHWINRPTMVRTTVTSTPVQRAFRHVNGDATYDEQVKPFNFVLSAVGAKPPAGIEIGSPFRLVAPYETDARKWETLKWIDVHHPDADHYEISTKDGRPGTARVDTFLDVVNKYETHPESKALGPDGRVCDRQTIGLLRRRPITAGKIVLIGKEANRLDERSSGELSADDLDQHLTTYKDDDEWKRFILPKLREIGAKAVGEGVGVSKRRARDWLTGKAIPHPATVEKLIELARTR